MAALKHSRQREAIREFLAGRKDHPTADVVYENLKAQYPNISLGTVYRNLSLLAELGEIQKLAGFGGADHFDGCTAPHFHFLCRECGGVRDMDAARGEKLLEQASAEFTGGRIFGYQVQFYGICGDCLKKVPGSSEESKPGSEKAARQPEESEPGSEKAARQPEESEPGSEKANRTART